MAHAQAQAEDVPITLTHLQAMEERHTNQLHALRQEITDQLRVLRQEITDQLQHQLQQIRADKLQAKQAKQKILADRARAQFEQYDPAC